jgi:hypothetical protein
MGGIGTPRRAAERWSSAWTIGAPTLAAAQRDAGGVPIAPGIHLQPP